MFNESFLPLQIPLKLDSRYGQLMVMGSDVVAPIRSHTVYGQHFMQLLLGHAIPTLNSGLYSGSTTTFYFGALLLEHTSETVTD